MRRAEDEERERGSDRGDGEIGRISISLFFLLPSSFFLLPCSFSLVPSD
jgi:hypothetical protein